MAMSIEHTRQRVTKEWSTLAHIDGMKTVSRMVAFHVMCKCSLTYVKVPSRKKVGTALTSAAIAFEEASYSVREKEALAFDVCERSAAVNKAARAFLRLHLKQTNSALINNALYKVITNRNKVIEYIPPSPKLP